ncbi:hypothetical protein L6164_029377 [Bauhinia variegata]|uniref:Uncharacterized protein n=1 Tax=Bauhinia variegata TaxID=167791 RepID=A0ACB9L9W5_BAUVA|nr:hypothetical protein L6164_029377 [Bauhinia variegata]
MGFSLTIMALLARLRVLVQQILLDVISLFNMVSSLSQKKQSVKITQDGIEVFREFYPISYDFVTLECVWESDKFVLLEKKHKIENASATKEDCEGNVYSQASAVNYESIETFLDDPPASEKVDAESAVKEGPSSVKDINTDSLMASSGIEEDKDIEGGEKEGENLGIIAVPSEELPPEGGLHALSQPSPSGKLDSGSKKVAFVSIKNLTSISQSVNSLSPCSANVKAAHFMESETNNDKEETLASILSEGIAKDSLF